jgi:hypothetical protein
MAVVEPHHPTPFVNARETPFTRVSRGNRISTFRMDSAHSLEAFRLNFGMTSSIDLDLRKARELQK